jgi:hypothetical protein
MAAKKKRSTTRSATSLESLSNYTFFLDRALESQALRHALVASRLRVEMHGAHFPADAPDIQWLPEIASRGWIVLSTDQFNWLERRAIVAANGRAFLLMSGILRGSEQVSLTLGALPRILNILKNKPAPFIAKIYTRSRVQIMQDPGRYR